jgi:hypothetical protein
MVLLLPADLQKPLLILNQWLNFDMDIHTDCNLNYCPMRSISMSPVRKALRLKLNRSEFGLYLKCSGQLA